MSKLCHPNVVQLLAARAWPPDYAFIVPFYQNGTLAELIHTLKWKPSWGAIINHSIETARGIK